jgi:hypothetical protein
MNYSLRSYRSIIEQALAAGYTFAPFTLEETAVNGRIYLRHDVDYSLEMALELARVNADLGVQGTFCVLLRSQVYNLLSPWSQSLVNQIHDLGQHIALHAALPAMPPGTGHEIETTLRSDFDFVQRNLPVISPAFSWHNPTPEVLEWSLPLVQIAGLVNTYAARFTRDIGYFSDSNMRYSVEDFLRLVSNGQRPTMQLLFHPLNWVVGGDDMRDVLAGTWRYVIREREYGMRTNYSYQAALPGGMPEAVLQSFAGQWLRAAEEERE